MEQTSRAIVSALGVAAMLTVTACGSDVSGTNTEALSGTSASTPAPIILVHGFAGFGRNELFGFKYWGGEDDLETHLVSQGHPTKTAVMGPVSSTWDRAIELYYQIKGGCVDYGSQHSKTFGHMRGVPELKKCWHTPSDPSTVGYPEALYPEWDASHPVHFVSHSQGAQTAKMLVRLLENGGAPLEPGIFGTAKTHWVKSVTSLSGSLNGTTLTHVATGYIPIVKQLVAGFASLVGVAQDNMIYDFKLDQWGLKRNPGEGFISYESRVFASSIWADSNKDTGLWSLSPEGAAEENGWVETSPDVYYFSYATQATYPLLGTGHVPYVSGSWLLCPFGGVLGMGTYSSATYDGSWQTSDCIVSTKSQFVPWNPSSTMVDFTGTPVRGQWNHMGLLDGYDHMDVMHWPSSLLTLTTVDVGRTPVGPGSLWSLDGYRKFYVDIATRLDALP